MTAPKTYLVQTWNENGGLKDHYEVSIEKPAELVALRKFLREKTPHHTVTEVPKKRPPARKR